MLSSLFNDLYEKNKLIKMLLKHDAIIYGPYIRDVITNQFDHNHNYTILSIIPNIYKKIIERNLYNYIEEKIDSKNLSSLKCEKIDYILKKTINSKKNNIRIIRIYYVTEILSFDKNGSLRDIHKYLLLDINSLGITRNGISIVGNSNNIELPNPFYNILQNIQNKEFTIIGKITNKYDLDLIYNYMDMNWKLKNRKIIEKTGKSFLHDDVCNICMENIKITDKIYKLSSCKHFYHRECWRKNVYQYLKNYYTAGSAIFDKEKYIKCPHCRKEYLLKDVL